MGLCLFEHAEQKGAYFAVNVAHVDEVVPHKLPKSGMDCCILKFSMKSEGFSPIAAGSRDMVWKILMDAAKVGMKKAEAEILSGKKMKATPLLINDPNRIALAWELPSEQLFKYDIERITATQLVFCDGKARIIAGRPGTLAYRLNAEGKVPGAPPLR